jgi:hypothetical protein
MALKTTQVPVTATAVKLTGTDADCLPGSGIAIQAPSGATLWIGGDNTVSATSGFPVAAGTTQPMDLLPGEDVWGVLASGTGTAYVLRTGV